MVRRLVLVLGSLLALAACRVDVVVELTMRADGSGELTVVATADAEVVADAPGLAEDLRFDDAVAAGWVIEGPAATDEGGLMATLRHEVTSAEDASNLLAGLGPPFADVRLARAASDGETTVSLSGSLHLAAGFDSFGDTDMLDAVGATPYAAEIAAAGATPSESMSFVFRADLPGAVESTTGRSEGGALQWDARLDGSTQDLATRTVQRPTRGGSWARPLSWVALAALVVWVLLAVAFIAHVVRVRRARARRRAQPRLRL